MSTPKSTEQIVNGIYSLLADIRKIDSNQDCSNLPALTSLDDLVDELSYSIEFTEHVQEQITIIFDLIETIRKNQCSDLIQNIESIQNKVAEISNVAPPLPPPPPRRNKVFKKAVISERNHFANSSDLLTCQPLRQSKSRQQVFRRTTCTIPSPVEQKLQDPILEKVKNEILSPLTIAAFIQQDAIINLPTSPSYNEMVYLLTNLKQEINVKFLHYSSNYAPPNIKAAITRVGGGDVCDIFISASADKTARRIINGMPVKQAVKNFANSTDLARVAEDQQQIIKRVDLESLAVRKSSTRTRIGAAMTVLTHFLEPHEIENEQMAERMIIYEHLAYETCIMKSVGVPEMLEDLMSYGSLANYKEVRSQALNIKSTILDLIQLVPQIYLKAANVVGGEVIKKIEKVLQQINPIVKLTEQSIKGIEIDSDQPTGGSVMVHKISKALQSNGSQLLSIIWAIVHLPPTDEGKLQPFKEEKANFGLDRQFGAQILLFFEFLSLGITIVTNIKAYYSALQSLEQPKHYLPILKNPKSTKLIKGKNKNKIIAGGLCGLLIAARENKLDADALYHSLSQYGKDIATILPSIPPEYAPAIIQRILATCYADIDQEKVEEYIQSNSTPIYNALRTRLATAKSTLEKQVAKCLTPATDFLIPSEPRSPLFTIAQTDATTIAKQFVKISFNKYNELKIKDFFSNGKAVSIIKQTAFKTSDWVCGSVLSCPDNSSRAFMKIQFCSILRELLKLGDFNTAYGVYLGISEIKIDFGKSLVPDQALQSFQKADKLFGANNQHYKLLKNRYKKYDICIPFIECVLDEIERIKSVQPRIYKGKTPDEEGLINFMQNIEIYNEVVNFLQYQKKTYNIATVEPLHSYLTDLPSFNNDIQILLKPISSSISTVFLGK